MPHPHHHSGVGAEIVPLLLIGAVLLVYVTTAVRQRGTRRGWSAWRTVAFVVGVMLMAISLWPPLMEMGHRDLRVHMLQHLLLGMLAPLGLVLGAPMTLALRTLPHSAARGLVSLLHTPPLRFMSHPAVALLLNVGGMYALYLTPLYALTLRSAPAHWLVHAHFLAAGYLFTWSIAGPDPAPRRPSQRVRLIVLFLAMATHATLGKLMYAHLWPRGTPHAAEEIRSAAQVMYYGGDLAELLLAIILFAGWYRLRGRRSASPAASGATRGHSGVGGPGGGGRLVPQHLPHQPT